MVIEHSVFLCLLSGVEGSCFVIQVNRMRRCSIISSRGRRRWHSWKGEVQYFVERL